MPIINPNLPQQSMSDRQFDLMNSMSDLGTEEERLKQQMEMAKELRGTEMPGMRGNSRVQVRANPLEFINQAVKTGYGHQQFGAGQTGMKDLADMIRKRANAGRLGPTNTGADMQEWGY